MFDDSFLEFYRLSLHKGTFGLRKTLVLCFLNTRVEFTNGFFHFSQQMLGKNTHIVFGVSANFTESRFNLKSDKIIKLNPMRTI